VLFGDHIELERLAIYLIIFISLRLFSGGYLLTVEWSGFQVPTSPFKVHVTNKGHSAKVKVEGSGLRGGFVGQDLRAVVDTTEAGNGGL